MCTSSSLVFQLAAAKQVAFGFGGAATSIRTYGVPKGGSSSRSSSSGFEPQDPISDGKQILFS